MWLRRQGPGGPRYQYPQPTSLHDERIRHVPDGQLYATIANGVRNMPGYSAQIPVSDRWAIVSYVRALQLSQINTGATP
ncbi:MAG: cytochrome c [Deltaproteobacteria bacterium]|nr:cytochrome c [Deltaproteobacteria bacterium]